MKNLLFLLLLFSALPFAARSSLENFYPTDTLAKKPSHSLDSLWQVLVFEKGGCLTGGQRVINGKFGSKRCVLTDDPRVDWKPFFAHSKEELTEFLITKFADTSLTTIHTCPFYSATNGEIAVYCLVKIHMVNWYDFEPFIEYRDREAKGADDSEQAWLHGILADPKQRQLLIDEWMKL